MVRALGSAGLDRRPVAVARSCSSLGFVIILGGACWAGALWLTRIVVHAAAGG